MNVRWLWWMFSPWYRRIGTRERAEAYISRIATDQGITKSQAVAKIWSELPEAYRPVLIEYKTDNA